MKTTKSLRAQLGLECFEDRLTPASFVYGAGDLVIVGNSANNTVVVSTQKFNGVEFIRVTENGVNQFHLASSVSGGDVYFYGYAGSDYFRNDTALRAHAWGHAGTDTLIGGTSHDYLDGGIGTDFLYGRAGNDKLIAGYDFSVNSLSGGEGNDTLVGGYGRDHMFGDGGNDYMCGLAGNDYMRGGKDNDYMYGDAGSDEMHGDDGNDRMWGGADNDRMFGLAGSDLMFGELGNDYLDGGVVAGIDIGDGGPGADLLVNFP
jgi:Ca2+-binding RTX toxin-like protein